MLVGELIVLAIFLVIGVVALAQGKGHGDAFSLELSTTPHLLLAAGLRRGVDRGAVLPRLRRHLDARRGEPGATPARSAGRWSLALLLAGVAVHRADLGRRTARARPARDLIAKGDPAGTAFYDAARVAGGALAGRPDRGRHRHRLGLRQLPGRPGRHVPAALRDGPRPAAAARSWRGSTPRHKVPVNATLRGRRASRSSLGALHEHAGRRDHAAQHAGQLRRHDRLPGPARLRRRRTTSYGNGSRDWWRHLVVPLIGFLILLYVVINAKVAAQVLGFVWLRRRRDRPRRLLRHRAGGRP